MATAAIGPAINLGSSIISSIFGGMAQRAKQAANENAALQQVIQGYDQALDQLNQAYNAGQIGPPEVLAAMAELWTWYWQVITPQIQPNRNGCASGSNCPNAATPNGEPSNYCSGNIGATCCVGCGPVRLGMTTIEKLMQAGGRGSTSIPTIVGNHYGVQTRPAYTLNWNPPSGGLAGIISSQPLRNVGTAGSTLNTRFGGPSLPTAHYPVSIGTDIGTLADPNSTEYVPPVVSGVPSAVGGFSIGMGGLLLGGFFLLFVLLIARR